MNRYPQSGLNNLIKNGNDEYDDFYDLPFEAKQAVLNHSHDFTFEEIDIDPRFLIDDYRDFYRI